MGSDAHFMSGLDGGGLLGGRLCCLVARQQHNARSGQGSDSSHHRSSHFLICRCSSEVRGAGLGTEGASRPHLLDPAVENRDDEERDQLDRHAADRARGRRGLRRRRRLLAAGLRRAGRVDATGCGDVRRRARRRGGSSSGGGRAHAAAARTGRGTSRAAERPAACSVERASGLGPSAGNAAVRAKGIAWMRRQGLSVPTMGSFRSAQPANSRRSRARRTAAHACAVSTSTRRARRSALIA